MTIGCILMAIGLALTILHFTTEDILGLEDSKRDFLAAQKTQKEPVVFKSKSMNVSEIKDDPAELTKYTALKVQESALENYAVDIPRKFVNPGKLKYFMSSTIGESI